MGHGMTAFAAKAPSPRVGETVPIVGDTPLLAFSFLWQVRPPADSLVVVVKGTFDLVQGGPAVLCADQAPPPGDCRCGSEEKASLRYASDFVPFKPKADVMLVGHAYPAANPTMSAASLRMGGVRRTLAVFGDRSWGTLGAQSKPNSFERMPLRWEHALGGPLSEVNPVGRGFKTGVLLPNIERPESARRVFSGCAAACLFRSCCT